MRRYAALLAVLAAPVLGGAHAPWAAGVVALLVGLAMAMGGRRLPPWWMLAGAGLLLVAVGAGWLPASAGGMPEWRAEFARLFGGVGDRMAVQPGHSLTRAVYLVAGLGFALWLMGQDWTGSERRWLAARFCGGIALLAAASWAFAAAGYRVPFWEADRGFGPFTNRNQTGALFALGAILSGGLFFDALLRGKKRAWAWGGLAAVSAAGAFGSTSRGAVLMVFAGLGVWGFGRLGPMRSAKWGAVAGAILLGAAALFFAFGGDVTRRFFGPEGVALGFRGLVYRDALRMIAEGPWAGVGLGSFADVFPQFREASQIRQRVLHPESDWLWLAAEAGWGGVVAVLLMAVGVFVSAFPMGRGSGRSLRWACLVAGMFFAAHAAVDVSGHRLGTMLPALLLCSMAVGEKGVAPAGRRVGVRAGWVAAGLAVAVAGGWLLGRGDRRVEACALGDAGKIAEAERLAEEVLRERPLDAGMAFFEANCAALRGEHLAALRGFRRARFLDPGSVDLPFDEGMVWAAVEPRLAMQAWREALARCGEGEYEAMFERMFREAAGVPGALGGFRELAAGRPSLILRYLEAAATPEEADLLLAEFGEVSQGWGEADRERFRFLAARRHALAGDFAGACEKLFGLLPSAPRPGPGEKSAEEALRAHLLAPEDLAGLWVLAQARIGEEDLEGAVAALEKAAGQPGCPPHFLELLAVLHAERGEWAEAWKRASEAR